MVTGLSAAERRLFGLIANDRRAPPLPMAGDGSPRSDSLTG